jgi:hypothetical protein
MANYCWNCIAIYRGDDTEASKRQIQELYLKLDSLGTAHSVIKTEAHTDQTWYGNILTMCGEDAKDVDGRGSIEDISWENDGNKDGGWIRLQTETAWEPQMEIIEKLIEKYYPNLAFEYIAEECGNGIYENSDDSGRFFTDRYKLDYDYTDLEDGDCDQDYYADEVKFKEAVMEMYKKFTAALKKHHLPKLTLKDGLYHSGEEMAFSIVTQMQDYISKHEDRFPGSYICAHKFE